MQQIPVFKRQLAQFKTFNRSARLFLLAIIMDGIVYSAGSLFFNFYILESGFSREFLGLVTAITSAAALLTGIPLGLLSDRIGRKRAMMLGVAVYIAAYGLELTVRHPALILVSAFIAGAANILYYISQAPFMMQASDSQNRTLLFSLSFGLVTLSGAVGSLFAGQLPALFGNLLAVPATSATAYQAVLLMAVMLSTLTLIPLSLIREPENANRPGTSSIPRLPVGRILTRKITVQLALPNLCIGFGAAILIPYMNIFFHDRFGISDTHLGLLFSLSALMTGIGSIIGPRFAERLGSKIRAVVITQGLSLAFLIVMGFSPLLGLAEIGLLVRASLMNMAVPLYDAFAMEQVAENEQATVNSVRNAAWQFGWAVGPYISGVIQAQYGFTPLFIMTGLLYAAATSITWLFFHTREANLILNPIGINPPIIGD